MSKENCSLKFGGVDLDLNQVHRFKNSNSGAEHSYEWDAEKQLIKNITVHEGKMKERFAGNFSICDKNNVRVE